MSLPALSRVEAARELQARRNARAKVIDFTTYTFPQYVVDPVHNLIASELDKVIAGETKRLMIFAPPQHGKSELTSVRLAGKWMGDRPDDPVAIVSYGADLAQAKSRQVRDLVESDEYRALYGDRGTQAVEPVQTRDDSRAVNHWGLAYPYRGSLWAGGVGGPITGHGFMLGVIDDPFENWAAAQSLTIRNKVWEWWQGTFRTRIWENGAIVLIMTRWHEDDLAGRILKAQPGMWKVLRLPAIAETQEERDNNNKFLNFPTGEPDPLGRKAGEALAPSRFSREALLEIMVDVGSRVWAAEYQGVPRPADGDRFKREWFEIAVGQAPKAAARVRYWDKAGTEGAGAFTAGVLIAHWKGVFYVEDVVRGQWSAGERETIIKQTAQLDAQKYGRTGVTIWVEQEPGSGGKESAENTIRNLAGFKVYKEPVTGSKDVRMQPFEAQCEALNVKLVRGPWNHNFIEELIAIPGGTYRDQADAAAGAFNKLVKPTRSPKSGKGKGIWTGPKIQRRPA